MSLLFLLTSHPAALLTTFVLSFLTSGVIYMIQLRNEQSAGGLFDSLLAGTNRGK